MADYIDLAYQDNIDLLQLDEKGSMGFTLKTMSAAVWAYLHSLDFFSGLRTIIEQGGDADTNADKINALIAVNK